MGQAHNVLFAAAVDHNEDYARLLHVELYQCFLDPIGQHVVTNLQLIQLPKVTGLVEPGHQHILSSSRASLSLSTQSVTQRLLYATAAVLMQVVAVSSCWDVAAEEIWIKPYLAIYASRLPVVTLHVQKRYAPTHPPGGMGCKNRIDCRPQSESSSVGTSKVYLPCRQTLQQYQ